MNWSWQTISRAIGLGIVLTLFLLFCVSTADKDIRIDKALALPFLTIASALIGIPSAYKFVVMRNGSNGTNGSGKSGPPSR